MTNTETNTQTFSDYIEVKGAKVNNLKNIDINIKRGLFTVITGVSGSGKSSLAFDTLYAEGQRRYVESLSSYARQFLGRMNKPEVDYIKGIPPAIAVEQKVNTRNPRSTVGTSTEIYDYMKLLYARAGVTISPVSGKPVKHHEVSDIVKTVKEIPQGTLAILLSPFVPENGRTVSESLEIELKKGFTRIEFSGKIEKIDDILKLEEISAYQKCNIVIDRFSVSHDEEFLSRIADSAQTAFYEGKGEAKLKVLKDNKIEKEFEFSSRFEADGIQFEIPTTYTFSFNNPIGACPLCTGFGKAIGIDKDLVIPNKNLSVYEEAVQCWKGEKMSYYKDEFIKVAAKFDFPIHRPYYKLSEEHKNILWNGNKHYEGLYSFFEMLEKQSMKIQYRVMLSRYRGKTTCPECNGTRLKKEAGYVKVSGKSISELVDYSIKDLIVFFRDIELSEHQKAISKRILEEIRNRLQYLSDVGLGYLTLNRLSSTLSGGESQRINLASSLGSSLVGSIYILDEPSIGLHSRDTELLIKVLKQLRDVGNTVVVVEHDEDIIRAADQVIDIGPYAGTHGGKVVFDGSFADISKVKNEINSLTVDYINGTRKIPVPAKRRKPQKFLEVIGASANNLKNIDVKFPLNMITVITGVSGSGKSSLVKEILYPALTKQISGFGEKTGNYVTLQGNIEQVEAVEFINQNPIGKSSRSNPITYIKAFDDIRKLFSDEHSAHIHGFTPAHFSFNVDGGRCDVCKGEGEINVEMQFMADVHLVCENCKGKRYKDEVLEVRVHGKNIYEVLEMTVDEAFEFFAQSPKTARIAEKIQPLIDVGLGYVRLGQSSNTLSGGESQRIKLASFLGKETRGDKTLFIFDEPTTGLHFHDISKLLKSFNALVENGHSLIVIEHNPEIIKSADYIIDIGPEGGESGGEVVFSGTPEELLKCKKSHTAKFLKEKLV